MDLSRAPQSHRYSVDEILQIILTCRKGWKTLKGQSEAVWPPYLEATMLKALQEYEPDDSRETRILGRYPMRNRFISDYIHSTTGKYRSAKQVGSRLQQLRDTAEGRELIDVLTRCYRTRFDSGACNAQVPVPQQTFSIPSYSPISSDSPSTYSSSSASPVTPVTPITPFMPPYLPSRTRQPPEPRMPVYIDILPSMGYDTSPPSTDTSNFRPSDQARHIRHIDPTVTFVSPSPVNGKSSYIVLLDGAPVHSENTTLDYVGPYFSSQIGPSSDDGPILYNTALVPRYWDVLCRAADPTLYTIVQDVYCVPDPVATQPQGHPQQPHPARIFSAIYHFQYRTSDAAPSYGNTFVGTSTSGPSMTSALDSQTLHGSVDLSYPVPFLASSTHTPLASEGLRTPVDMDQNLFDEPFMLDVNFEQIAFDDFAVNADSTSDSASSHLFPKDSNTFNMYDPSYHG